ncbi:MAG: hypothetical protein V3W41_05380 [Planctomycetota bacterium]
MANRRPSSLILTLIASAFIGTGCVAESEHRQVSDIKFADPAEKFETVAIQKVLLDGKPVGTLETMYVIDGDYNDDNDRYQHTLRDANGGVIGFVTDSNKAYRMTAHRGPDLVANHPSLERNLLLILERFEGKVTLERFPSTVEN